MAMAKEIKNKLAIQLISAERSAELLKEVPHKLVIEGECALIYKIADVEHSSQDYLAGDTVTNEMLTEWNITEDELHDMAIKSSVELLPAQHADFFGMHFLTNERKAGGAASLFYPGMVEKIAEELGEEYYIIPSSIHEVIFSPAEKDKEELIEAIRNVNASLEEEKILSDKLFAYRNGEILVA